MSDQVTEIKPQVSHPASSPDVHQPVTNNCGQTAAQQPPASAQCCFAGKDSSEPPVLALRYNLASSVTSAIAWPITTLIILTIFRKQFVEIAGCLVDFVKQAASIKFSKDGVTFSREVGEALEQAARVLPTYSESVEASVTEQAKASIETREAIEAISGSAKEQAHRLSALMEWASKAPHLGVLDSWRSVEIAAKTFLRSKGNNVSDATVGKELGVLLFKANALNADQLAVFNKLRRIRNEVSHGASQPWAEDAIEYVRLADSLIRQIKKS